MCTDDAADDDSGSHVTDMKVILRHKREIKTHSVEVGSRA